MSNDIRIKKGLDIKLKGEAEKAIENGFRLLQPFWIRLRRFVV